METFSSLLNPFAWNPAGYPPLTGWFPSQRASKWSFHVFFDAWTSCGMNIGVARNLWHNDAESHRNQRYLYICLWKSLLQYLARELGSSGDIRQIHNITFLWVCSSITNLFLQLILDRDTSPAKVRNQTGNAFQHMFYFKPLNTSGCIVPIDKQALIFKQLF